MGDAPFGPGQVFRGHGAGRQPRALVGHGLRHYTSGMADETRDDAHPVGPRDSLRTTRMRIHLARTIAALVVGAATLVACMGPTATRADLDRGANEVLDSAEAMLPALAESLGATLTEAHFYAERNGGSEGTTPSVYLTVHGTMVGPEPTQAELEQAVIDAGYTEIVYFEEDSPYRPTDPHVIAISADGTTKVSIGYSTPGDPNPGLGFDFRNVDAVRVSNATVDDFHEAPASIQTANLSRMANEMLDLAEVALPALAENLGAAITEAHGYAQSESLIEGETPFAFFVVRGWVNGPRPTQAELEQALIDAGYTKIVFLGDEQSSDYPYAVANSADGTAQITIGYSEFSDPEWGLEFEVRNIIGVRVSDATVEDFGKTFTRDFDQSLVAHEPFPASSD
jgi:hypothetical protein